MLHYHAIPETIEAILKQSEKLLKLKLLVGRLRQRNRKSLTEKEDAVKDKEIEEWVKLNPEASAKEYNKILEDKMKKHKVK